MYESLRARAMGLLDEASRANGSSTSIKPTIDGLEHASIAVGYSHIDISAALAVLQRDLHAQWSDGLLPRLGTELLPELPLDAWRSHTSPRAPREIATTGLIQVPNHATALRKIHEAAQSSTDDLERVDDFLRNNFDALFAWHEWLVTRRDPRHAGVLEITHPWESATAYGLWKQRLGRIETDGLADELERYGARFHTELWLLQEARNLRHDQDALRDYGSFRGTDVFLTSVFVHACEDLASLGWDIGRSREVEQLLRWADTMRGGILATAHPDTWLARDRDLVTGSWLPSDGIGGFASAFIGGDNLTALHESEVLTGPAWLGNTGLAYRTLAGVAAGSPLFGRVRDGGCQTPWLNSFAIQALHRTQLGTIGDQLARELLRQLDESPLAGAYRPGDGAPQDDKSVLAAAITLDTLDHVERMGIEL